MNEPTTKRVIVDPVTRIEGHLRIEAETDAERPHHARLFCRHHGARH